MRVLVDHNPLPESPGDFPLETKQISVGSTQFARLDVWGDVIDANREILKITNVPKIWNLPIRSLKDIPDC